jgi:hypothetical protein
MSGVDWVGVVGEMALFAGWFLAGFGFAFLVMWVVSRRAVAVPPRRREVVKDERDSVAYGFDVEADGYPFS